MQSSSGVNALLALAGTATAAHGRGGAALDAEDAAPDQAFSQLLSDFGAQGEGQASQNFARGAWLATGVGGAVTAQEMDLANMLAQGLPDDLMIAPEEATVLLQRIEGLTAQTATLSDTQSEALARIKDQVKVMSRGQEPVPLANLLAALPEESKGAGVIPLVIATLQGVKKTSETERATQEVPNQSLAMLQTMSATMFRPAMAENQPQATIAPTIEKKKSRDFVETVTVVEPLALTMTVAAATPALGQATGSAANLDQLVPPLARDETTHLPDIDLPKLLPTQADQRADRAFLPGNPSGVTDGATKDMQASGTITIGDVAAASANAIYPSHAMGHVATHASAISKAIDISPAAGLLNHAPVAEQVHVAIHQATKDGTDRITIQLDPIDLGRVEVNMHTSKDGHTQLFFTVDKPETFDGLSRDARMLERSLQEAGIKADTGSMQFNLRQQPQPNMQSGLGGQGQPQQQAPTGDDEESQHSSTSAIQPAAVLAHNYILNIREGVDISA